MHSVPKRVSSLEGQHGRREGALSGELAVLASSPGSLPDLLGDYQFPGAAITNFHKPGGLKEQKLSTAVPP